MKSTKFIIFFHPNDFRRAAKEGRLNDPGFENISPTPPSLTGVGGGYTEMEHGF